MITPRISKTINGYNWLAGCLTIISRVLMGPIDATFLLTIFGINPALLTSPEFSEEIEKTNMHKLE